ncbi:hypothetical protein SCG7109_AE_00260 [Chlamydiales bacterium SCGC AG-110-M15]|nr:hypothetical protein SCG7109_AE_00260 [Chlamydiales bacterium SCGC AG-110-M15]
MYSVSNEPVNFSGDLSSGDESEVDLRGFLFSNKYKDPAPRPKNGADPTNENDSVEKTHALREHIPSYFKAPGETPIPIAMPVNPKKRVVVQEHFLPKLAQDLQTEYHHVVKLRNHPRATPLFVLKELYKYKAKLEKQLKLEDTYKHRRYGEISQLENLKRFITFVIQQTKDEMGKLQREEELYLQGKSERYSQEARTNLIYRYIKKYDPPKPENAPLKKGVVYENAPRAQRLSSFSFSIPSGISTYAPSFASFTSSVSSAASSYTPSLSSSPMLSRRFSSLTSSLGSVSRSVSDYMSTSSDTLYPGSPLNDLIHKAVLKILSTFTGRKLLYKACPKKPHEYHDVMKKPLPNIERPIQKITLILSSELAPEDREKFQRPQQSWYAESRTIVIQDPSYGYGLDYLMTSKNESIDDQILRDCITRLALATLEPDLFYLKQSAKAGHATGIIYTMYYFTIYYAAMKISDQVMEEGCKHDDWNHSIRRAYSPFLALKEHKARALWEKKFPKFYHEVLDEANKIPVERECEYRFRPAHFDKYFEEFNDI